MIISNPKNAIEIRNRDLILTKVSTVKFLGITLDENIMFNDHVKNVPTKIIQFCWCYEEITAHCQFRLDELCVFSAFFYNFLFSYWSMISFVLRIQIGLIYTQLQIKRFIDKNSTDNQINQEHGIKSSRIKWFE